MFLSASDNSVMSTWLDRLGTEIFVTGHAPGLLLAGEAPVLYRDC